jgi:hypothetical protein
MQQLAETAKAEWLHCLVRSFAQQPTGYSTCICCTPVLAQRCMLCLPSHDMQGQAV